MEVEERAVMSLRWVGEAWDRVVASDPGMSRLRFASSAAVAMGSTLGVEYGFALLTGASGTNVIVAMLLGAVIAMMGSMALTAVGRLSRLRTAAGFPFAVGLGLLLGALVAGNTTLMLVVFVVVMFAAVFVRRFGLDFFFYGFMMWMGYFFASFLHATLAKLPQMLLIVVIATVWIALLSVTLLRANPTRTLRRTRNAFDARARSLARACADLLEPGLPDAANRHRPTPPARLHRRLRSRHAKLAEAALMTEAWSAEQGALPEEYAPAGLRRALMDVQQALDRMANAADALATGDPTLVAGAHRVADLLALRADTHAEHVARELLELAEGRDAVAGDGSRAAVQFAQAATEFIGVLRAARAGEYADAGSVGGVETEFEPAVELVFGNLPGSPAAARDVPARGVSWNPLARLDLSGRQAVQVSVAAALAIIVGFQLSPQRYYWAVLAAFIMFTGTSTRAETFIKGFNRVLGTLAGLVASIGLAELTGGASVWVIVTIIACMFCGFYLMRVSYAYFIFFLTIMLGQLYTVLHEFSPGLLILRLEETAIGAAIGFVVALLVVPLSTRDTVRAARDLLLTELAALLNAAGDRLGARPAAAADLDALARGLDDRLRALTLVAKPMTRPLLWGNSPARTRHRLTLYAAAVAHARTIAVELRDRRTQRNGVLAGAAYSLAAATSRLVGTQIGKPQPAATPLLSHASAALFTDMRKAGCASTQDPLLRSLLHLQQLIGSISVTTAKKLVTTSDTAALHGVITDGDGAAVRARVVLLAVAQGADGPGSAPVNGSVGNGSVGNGSVGNGSVGNGSVGNGSVGNGVAGNGSVGNGVAGDGSAGGVAPGTAPVATTSTDDEGGYMLTRCPPGRYLAVITAEGYQPVAAHVSLVPGVATPVNFEVTTLPAAAEPAQQPAHLAVPAVAPHRHAAERTAPARLPHPPRTPDTHPPRTPDPATVTPRQ